MAESNLSKTSSEQQSNNIVDVGPGEISIQGSGRDKVLEKIEKLAEEVAVQENCLIYDVEFVGTGKGRTLRVFVDRSDGNVGIDDCSNVSKGLNAILDADEDIIPGGSYNLEVSTPGLERSLRKKWHFEKVIGKKIWIKSNKALESAGVSDKKWKLAKTIEDVLQKVDEEGITFVIKEVTIKVPFEMIEKAKLVFDMNKGLKK